MKKTTSIAPSNIAFIKYWGKKDEDLKLPENGSISMNLSKLTTTTTVEFDKKLKKDQIYYNGIEIYAPKIIQHLDRLRKIKKVKYKAKVATVNNFPEKTGLSSSASGFAALTLAAAGALELKLSAKELSILARQGSGSACRSIPDGFVEWLDGDTNDDSYAVSLFPPEHWDIVNLVSIISTNPKHISTTKGQKLVKTSSFFNIRQKHIKNKVKLCKKLLKEKNFTKFGELIESEALELHAIMMTSKPYLLYLLPETLMLIKQVIEWRKKGLPVYFTLNTGQNVHLIIEGKNVQKLKKLVDKLSYIRKTIVNRPSEGARITNKHLF